MWATMLNTAVSPNNVNSKAEQTAEIYSENLQKYFGRYPNSGVAFLTIMLSMFAGHFCKELPLFQSCFAASHLSNAIANLQLSKRARELESLKASRMSEVGGSLGYIVSIPAYHYHQASQSHHNNVTQNMHCLV